MTAAAGPVAGFLRRLSQDGLTDLPDGDLLARFLRDRDEAAFAQLVFRHGTMVLGAARRVLGNSADAEDVTQAVFLILARQAGRFAGVPNVGGWLHGVAVRTALHAKSRRHRRRVVEARAAKPEAAPAVVIDDLAAVVDRAVQSLPAKLRDAVVLCDLEGQSRQQAADRLGVPLGTVSSRLSAAHAKLAAKLARPFAGVVLVGAAMADALAGATLAAVFTHDSRGVPAAVSVLVMEVTRMMWLTKLKLAVAGVVVALAVGATGVGSGRYATAEEPKAVPKPAADDPGRTAAHWMMNEPRLKPDTLAIDEAGKFTGTWRLESRTMGPNLSQVNRHPSTEWMFDGKGRCMIRQHTDSDARATLDVCDYVVNPHRKLKELFFLRSGYSSVIYELDGDTLRTAEYFNRMIDRPHGFTVAGQPPGSPELVVTVWKRISRLAPLLRRPGE